MAGSTRWNTAMVMDARVFNLRDARGQPIGGVAAPDYDEARVQVQACPYPDRRRGRPMDLTALAAVTEDWLAILQVTRALSGPRATVHRGWRTCMALLHAPIFYDEERRGQPIPLPMSGAFKVCLGFSQALTRRMLAADGVADQRMAVGTLLASVFNEVRAGRSNWRCSRAARR